MTMEREQTSPDRPTLPRPLDKQSPAAEGRMSFPAKFTKTTRNLQGGDEKIKLDPFHRPHRRSIYKTQTGVFILPGKRAGKKFLDKMENSMKMKEKK